MVPVVGPLIGGGLGDSSTNAKSFADTSYGSKSCGMVEYHASLRAGEGVCFP
jgi:hypothetical protein